MYPFRFLLLFGWNAVCAQAVDSVATPRLVVPISTVPAQATADQMGNIIYLLPEGIVNKIAPDGRPLYHFSTTRLGQATSLDATNPLKIMVWFSDFSTILWLDRSLTTLGGDLNLNRANFPNVRTVGMAADGNIWLYDEVGFKLRKITPDGTQLFESQDLNLIFNKELHPTCIRDDGTRVVVVDSLHGLLQFNVYGQFIRQIAGKGITSCTIEADGSLRYLDPADQFIHRINPDFPVPMPLIPLPAAAKGADAVWLVPRGIMIYKEGQLSLY